MAIYYVRPDGNNNNSGTGPATDQAWATITKAVQTAVAGDIVRIAPGTYREAIAPTNSGTSGSLIVYEGDPTCQYFTDLAMDDVIFAGILNPTYYQLETTNLITLTSKSYIEFRNVIMKDCTNYVINGGANITLINCKLYSTRDTVMVNFGGDYTIDKCFFHHYSRASTFTAGAISSVQLSNSVILGNINTSPALSITMTHCLLHGSFQSSDANVACYGCKFTAPSNYFNATDGPYCFNIIGSILVTFYGCEFVSKSGGGGLHIGTNGYAVVKGCKFIGCNVAIKLYQNSSWRLTIDGCEFKDCYAAVKMELSGTTFSGTFTRCTYDSCLYPFVSNASISAQYTFDTCSWYSVLTRFESLQTMPDIINPHYGPIPDSKRYGSFITTSNPIAGTKSLMCAGYDYTPVFMQWIACEAGKPKTVTLKAKRANTGSNLPKFILGTAEAIMADNTDVQSISLTYTHHKNELVPLMICGRVNTSGSDYFLVDDIGS